MEYEDFKRATIEASDIITKAKDMRAVSDDFENGFQKAMWEAREIFMRLEDKVKASEPKGEVDE